MTDLSREQLAAMIDHAVLQPDATTADLLAGCKLARRLGAATMFVRPCDVAAAAEMLAGGGTALGTVIGFPHGSTHPRVKLAEANQAVADGADELDMVANIARLREGDQRYVRDEIASVVSAGGGRIVKVILECCYLDHGQMAVACRAAEEAGANFVKTSTGFAPGGATDQDVRFLREQVGDRLGVKASGGIRTLADALAMIAAGASRIGTSSTEQILEEVSC